MSPRCRQTEKHTRLAVQQRGQGLCPGQPVCSCSAVFYSTGLHKQTAPRAAAFKMDSRMQSQARAHTQTHIHVGIRLEMLIKCVHTKQKPPSLDIFRRLSYQCACPQQRRHRRMFPCPWWLSDEGHRWGMKGRGGRDGE